MRFVVLYAVLAASACGTDEPAAGPYQCIAAGGQSCFEMPTAPIAAADPTGALVDPALGCGPESPIPSSAPITLSGTTADFDDPALGLPLVRLEAWSDPALTVGVFDVTSDTTGAWSTTVDALPSIVHARTTAAGQLPIYTMYAHLDVTRPTLDMRTFPSATRAQVEAMLGRVGDRFDPARTQVIAAARDCAGNALVNVVANVAPASGKNGARLFVPGVRVYYAGEVSTRDLGRRTELIQTTTTGSLAIANVTEGTRFLQLWGFASEQDVIVGAPALVLVAEVELEVYSEDAAVFIPLRAH